VLKKIILNRCGTISGLNRTSFFWFNGFVKWLTYAIAYLDGTLSLMLIGRWFFAQITPDRARLNGIYSVCSTVLKAKVLTIRELPFAASPQTGNHLSARNWIPGAKSNAHLRCSCHESLEGKAIYENNVPAAKPLFIISIRDVSVQKKMKNCAATLFHWCLTKCALRLRASTFCRKNCS